MNDFRETLYTVDAKGRRKWVYPVELSGFFKRRRTAVAWTLLLVYISLPWITIGGSQAVHLDIAHRRFVFFGTTFWATDTRFLALILASLAMSLFFFTSLFGRVWCGWACPQTVFLEFVFRPLERLIEGTANRRRTLDAQPWSWTKAQIKLLKFSVFTILAWFMASTLLAYFIGRETLLTMMTGYPWENWPTFLLTLFFMGVVLFEFGWFREQFCTVVCPYARFQSVLLDDTSLVISYDEARGEPRGKPNKNVGDKPRGDCIDCGLCVRVCPTGIDIRNGLQLECVQCAVCADACDSIMTNLDRPKGLIRYATERGLRGEPTKILRPRVLIYGSILTLLFAALGVLLSSRELSEASVYHSKGSALFEMQANRTVTNHLELHLANKSTHERRFSISAPDTSQITLTVPLNPFPVAAQSVSTVPLFVGFPPELLRSGRHKIALLVTDDAGFSKRLDIDLLGPG